jgi:hypothetical protein
VDALQIASVVGAVALAAVAVPILVLPRLVEKRGVMAADCRGRLEVRGICGGPLSALAAVCPVTREPYAILTAEAALLGFSGVGFISLAGDHPQVPRGLDLTGVHTLLGLLLLAGFWGW